MGRPGPRRRLTRPAPRSLFDHQRSAATVGALLDQQQVETLADALVLLARLGELEMALARLMEEQRKAQKRVNALKYNIIPRYRRTIHFIQSALEEEERNTLFQIKVLREQQRV